MTYERIAELKELADNATPGPWGKETPTTKSYSAMCGGSNGDDFIFQVEDEDGILPTDFKFIATARTAIPELIAALEKAQITIANIKRDFHTAQHDYRIFMEEAASRKEEAQAEIARLKAMMPHTPTTCAYFKPVGVCMCPHTTRDVWNCRTYEGGTCARDAWQLQEGSDG